MGLLRGVLAVLMLAASLPPVWPLEFTAGSLKLALHERIGRFGLYSEKKPLFVDHDPRTSYVALLLEGRVYRLGDSAEFALETASLPDGARFAFSGKRCSVDESFVLREPGALELSITVTNRTERELSVGARFLLDTSLGEDQQSHFLTDRRIDSETGYEDADMPGFWQSGPPRRGDSPGLRGVLRGGGATTPDRLVLANWKRLNEAAWLYEPGAGRSFSDLPYSIDDSAVCQYYDPLPLAPGASRTIVIVLRTVGAEAGAEAVAQVVAQPGADQKGLEAQAAKPGREELGLQGDLRVLNGLLEQLDRKLQTRSGLSDEELRLMEQILAELKKRLERTAE